MKTIEERAKEWSNQCISQSRKALAIVSYEKGADDQKEIDIEKACEWWTNFCNEHGILVYKEHIDAFTKSMNNE